MKRPSLKTRLLHYLIKHKDEWIAKGRLCDLARKRTGAIGETVGRRLQELEVANLIKVKHIKGHSWYCYEKGTMKKEVIEVEVVDGVAYKQNKIISV